MSKTTKKAPRTRKPATKQAGTKTNEAKPPREELCVFAFRLTAEERAAIHKAAGPGKASKFARNLLVAAARKDNAAVKAIMKEVPSEV